MVANQVNKCKIRECHSPKKSRTSSLKRQTTTKKKATTKSKKSDTKAVNDNYAKLPPKSAAAAQKASKRALRNEAASPLGHHHHHHHHQHQPERSNSDSLPDSCAPGNEYRALRRKYLLLEEESFSLGSNLRGVEDEVKTLEDEKLALLDKLVVLEGLICPSELQSL